MPSILVIREPTVTVVARPQFLAPPHLTLPDGGAATDAERLMEFAGRVRSASLENPAGRSTHEYFASAVAQRHLDLMAHASCSLLLEGISRAAAHALHRDGNGIACAEVLPRHVDETTIRFVLPPALIGDEAMEGAWCAQMEHALEGYRRTVDALMVRYGWIDDKVHRRRLARDAAQDGLPGGVEARVVMTGSIGAWRTLLTRHTSESAPLELRRLCLTMLHVLQQEAPACFSDFEVYQAFDRREAARTR